MLCKKIIANIPPDCKGQNYVMLEVFMLNRVVSVKVSDFWLSFVKRLARDSGRTKADFIRDLVYLLIVDDELGQVITQRLKSEPPISYAK